MSDMYPETDEEREADLALLRRAWDRFPWLTLGELVHVAAREVGKTEDDPDLCPWGCTRAGINIGLRIVAEAPPNTEPGPSGLRHTETT